MAHAPEYSLYQNGKKYGQATGFIQQAVEVANNLLSDCCDPTTITVENEDGYVPASVTNRRTIGEFVKQQ